ncbi:MAG: Ig-like domain-containing protein, partial [Promethearchaeota archaeon]
MKSWRVSILVHKIVSITWLLACICGFIFVLYVYDTNLSKVKERFDGSTVEENITWPLEFDINPGGYEAFYQYREAGLGLIGHFEVVSGGGKSINFFLCDESNFNLWKSGKTAIVYLLHEYVTELNWTFIVPHSDTWYAVYDNSLTIVYTKHVVGWSGVDNTPPVISHNLFEQMEINGSLHIQANATDDYFSVDRVEIYIDGTLYDYTYSD